jgi:hypothetical protein
MDATRYTTHYRRMVESDPQTLLSPQTQDCEYVKMLWLKLLDAYIAPNAPRGVNLPSAVRDRLMSRPCTDTPPDAAELEPAVKIIYELMNESVLGPFLNAVAPRAVEILCSPWTSDESMMDTYMVGSLDERSLSPTPSRSPGKESSHVSRTGVATRSSSGLSTRTSPHSRPTVALCRTSSFPLSAPLPSASSTSSAPDAPNSSDDSTDSPSSASALDPMTPPHTPPTSDAGFAGAPPGTTPQTIRPEGHSWGKMGAMLGWKKGWSSHGSGARSAGGRDGPGREIANESRSSGF